MEKEQSMFEKVLALNVNQYVEKKGEGKNALTYLSWAFAWAEFKKQYPDAKYEIIKFDGRPYLFDKELGYMVFTKITANNETHEMWLPVMDGANKSMKAEPYTYKVKEYKDWKWTGEYTDKAAEAASMFDVNKTLMRCLVKNMAMFGLGLYIYAGEDLPITDDEPKVEEFITLEQAADIDTKIRECGANKEKFLEVMGVGDIRKILAKDVNKALNALAAKKKANDKKKEAANASA